MKVTICGHGSGRPSYKDLYEYTSSRPNNRRLLEVRRFKGITDNIRMAMLRDYDGIIGRNEYNQDLRDYAYRPYKDGRYYSDCSSSICRDAEKNGISGCGSWNTASMHYGMLKVEDIVITNGIIQNPEKLQPCDCLMFQGYDYNTSARPLGIGHVEMVYSIEGGSGGPGINTAPARQRLSKEKCLELLAGIPAIMVGEKGDRVKALQHLLNVALDLDEAGAPLFPDGDYGPQTMLTVQQFQALVNIPDDGSAGPETMANLAWYVFEKPGF